MGLVFFTAVLTAPSAQITTEQFNAGAGGWQGSVAAGAGSWTFTGGAARVNFANTGFPVPFAGTLSNTPSASGGSFTGDFEAAGIELIGFNFFTATSLPSSVMLSIGGATSVYQRLFYPAQTGVWQTFAASLQSAESGGWINPQGPPADFEGVLQNVKYVTIQVDRDANEVARQYVIDDIFLDRLPAAGGLGVATGGLLSLRADYLRSNTTYQVQASPEVTGTWVLAQTLVATNRSQSIEVTHAADKLFWRLLMP